MMLPARAPCHQAIADTHELRLARLLPTSLEDRDRRRRVPGVWSRSASRRAVSSLARSPLRDAERPQAGNAAPNVRMDGWGAKDRGRPRTRIHLSVIESASPPGAALPVPRSWVFHPRTATRERLLDRPDRPSDDGASPPPRVTPLERPRPSDAGIDDIAGEIARAVPRPPPDDQSTWILSRAAELPHEDEERVMRALTRGPRAEHAWRRA